MRDPRRFDESDIRSRPNRRGSRPRTKTRPAHRDAEPALVLAVDRGRYTLLVGAESDEARRVTAMKARELGTSRIVVGDRVDVVGDLTGRPDTLARVVRVADRETFLSRTADDSDAVERPIVANADQLVIVTALADPTPRPRMVDRCLVAAFDAGMTPLLCLTKADLADPAEFLELYEPLGIRTLSTRREGDRIIGLEAVREAMTGHTSVLIGHSGVGKSTLVNALVPEAERATGTVNDVTGRGRHTSSSAVMFELPGSDGAGPAGWVIDTPGVRSFGLARVDPGDLIWAFPDLAEVARDCPRGCTHETGAPDCALDDWVASGAAGPAGTARLASYRRLLASRTGAAEPPTADTVTA